jgi:hypothetical protein
MKLPLVSLLLGVGETRSLAVTKFVALGAWNYFETCGNEVSVLFAVSAILGTCAAVPTSTTLRTCLLLALTLIALSLHVTILIAECTCHPVTTFLDFVPDRIGIDPFGLQVCAMRTLWNTALFGGMRITTTCPTLQQILAALLGVSQGVHIGTSLLETFAMRAPIYPTRCGIVPVLSTMFANVVHVVANDCWVEDILHKLWGVVSVSQHCRSVIVV